MRQHLHDSGGCTQARTHTYTRMDRQTGTRIPMPTLSTLGQGNHKINPSMMYEQVTIIQL